MDQPPALREREEAAAAVRVPAAVRPWLEGRGVFRDLVGETGCAVRRLHRPGAPDLYLKHGAAGERADEVADEMARLRWLAPRFATPEVRAFYLDADGAWLLTTAVEGVTAWQALDADPAGRAGVAEVLGRFLRRLHALPVDDCPFDAGAAVRMAAAGRRVRAGAVDIDDFDEAREGWSADAVWDEVRRLKPARLDRVVTHGDFSLDNVLMQQGEVAGCIDVGRLGVADRWQDLAILWSCLGEFDAALQTRMLAAYGLARPDRAKLAFHLALDELF